MAYVDLNPFRALYTFAGYPRDDMVDGLSFRLTDYLELVDWTGRQLRDDKRGHINDALPVILNRLDLDQHNWMYLSTQFESRFRSIVSTAHTVWQALGSWPSGVRSTFL